LTKITQIGDFIFEGTYSLHSTFNKKQEKKLNSLRKDLYKFLQYAHKHKTPTIWPHPLYNYKKRKKYLLISTTK